MKRLATACAALASLVVVSSATAAFPGRNGLLAVQPLRGNGIVILAFGGQSHRICTNVAICGHPVRPRFSPDGRSIVFAGPAVRLIGSDGSCQNCRFGVARNPAFLPGGTLVSFVSGGLITDAIDGLRAGSLLRNATDAVWSASGELAVVDRRGRLLVGRGRLQGIGQGSSPSWSANGKRIAFVRSGWITVAGIGGGSARRLVRGSSPAFSPDGHWIAYIASRHQVSVVSASSGRARVLGGVSGTAVDWQPLPAHPTPCVAPPGSKVLAQSGQAVVTSSTGAAAYEGLSPSTAAMGCLFADGRERLLEQSTFNSVDGTTDFPLASVGAPFAAVDSHSYDPHYGGSSEAVDVFDLRTGQKSGFGGEERGCGQYDPTCGALAQLVVGSTGVSAARFDGGPGAGTDRLTVKCGSQSLCLATNAFGDVVATTDPASSPWTPAKVAQLTDVSCPSSSLCVGVHGTDIFTSTDPTGGTAAWTDTRIPVSWGLQAVDCPSVDFCAAVNGDGHLVRSTNPTGGQGAWSVDDIDGNTLLAGIACPTSTACVATDINGNAVTSTDPTGGPSAWTTRRISSQGVGPISCPSTSLCLTEGFQAIFASTDPLHGPWQAVGPASFSRPDCPTTSFCVVAAGPDGSIDVSTDPISGSWHRYAVGDGGIGSISCPTAGFCVGGGGGDGKVLVSNDPTGGASAWTPVLADKVDCSIALGACGTEQILASDRTGVHTLDSSTEFEPQTGPQLTALTLTGDTLSWSHSGSPRTAQLTP